MMLEYMLLSCSSPGGSVNCELPPWSHCDAKERSGMLRNDNIVRLWKSKNNDDMHFIMMINRKCCKKYII